MYSEKVEKSFNPRLNVDDFEIYLKNSRNKAALAETTLTGKKKY